MRTISSFSQNFIINYRIFSSDLQYKSCLMSYDKPAKRHMRQDINNIIKRILVLEDVMSLCYTEYDEGVDIYDP
jgi:hypothetical protein